MMGNVGKKERCDVYTLPAFCHETSWGTWLQSNKGRNSVTSDYKFGHDIFVKQKINFECFNLKKMTFYSVSNTLS
jgi:hypothetical protein